LYVNPDEVWYEVAAPANNKDHAFRAPRSQIIARQWVLMGQPQNITEIKFGRSTYHFWLLGNQDLANTPAGFPQQIALPYQFLISVIAAGGNPNATVASSASNNQPSARGGRPASRAAVAANTESAATPEKLLADALEAIKTYRAYFRQTGDRESVAQRLAPAREKAQSAHNQFLAKSDYSKAAESLVAVADIDGSLVMERPEEYEIKQEPIKKEYADALKLAEQAGDPAMQFKALKGLSRANLNSKDLAAASGQIDKLIDLALRSPSKDDLFDAYDMRANLEQKLGNLAGAMDDLERALNLSAEITEPILLWTAYTDRADIYNARADQCDFERNFDFCKKVFDSGMEDTRKALEVAERSNFGYLKTVSSTFLSERKLMADKLAESAAMFKELSSMDRSITKPSQVILETRFSDGPSPDLAAEVRKIAAQQQWDKSPMNAYDPMNAFTIGQMEEWDGNADAAQQHYLQAVRMLEGDRRKLGDSGTSSPLAGDQMDIYYAAALQHLDRKQQSEAFNLIERSRARMMAQLLASRQLSFRTPELQDLFSRSVSLDAQIGKAQNNLFDAAGSRQPDNGLIKDLQAKVDALQKQRTALLETIQQRAPKLAAGLGEQPPVSLQAAQAAARQGNYDLLYYISLQAHTLIWHICGDSVEVVKVYYSREQLSERVASLRKTLSDRNIAFDEKLAAELFLVLVNPVLPNIRTHHLVIVPHEDLMNLPFQILKGPDDTSYLGERFQISYAPSATILAGLNKRPDFTRGRMLAIADPKITNAVAEVNAIGQLYPGRAKVVTDALASKETLKSWTGGYNLLHLSVHGHFEPNSPLLSYIGLRAVADDDGRLTAAEMFGLNLPENSLVVLSACETGLVKTSHGNDTLGMVPALLFAGASTLVLSSWKVDAESTVDWMKIFYREAQTKSPSEAARLALVAVKNEPKYQHPFYWAPFMVTGP